MHRCSYSHEFGNLPADVRELLEDESYAAFLGQSTGGGEPEAAPAPLRNTVKRLVATGAFDRYTRGNHPLSERVAHEAVSWCDARWSAVREADSLSAEEQDIEALEACTTVEDACEHLPATSRAALRARAIATLGAEAVGAGHHTETSAAGRIEMRARISLVVDEWRKLVNAEKSAFQERELGKALGGFVRSMGEALPRLSKAQSIVRDLFGSEDALWDLATGQWSETTWDALEAVAATLESMPELNRLAEILGRSRVATETRTINRVVRELRSQVVGLGKSEVTGVNFGDDLTSILPSEAALLSDPDTEDLFYAKLAHKEMLQLDYRRERLEQHVRERTVWTTEEVRVPRGPVILCVDTSGSMLGTPEAVAKAMTLALARRLAEDRRDVHVIAFSTAIRSLTLHAPSTDLAALCDFLSGSFYGGTDLRPALAETLKLLDTESLRDADVLVISDFRIPKIADRFVDRIKAQQKRGTLFHSLTIARGAVRDPLNIFDNSWLFNISEGLRGIRPDTLRFLG